MMIELTERAVEKFTEIKRTHNRPNAAMRVRVEKTGCSNARIHIGMDEFRETGDLAIETQGTLVYIDPQSAPFLEGAKVGWDKKDGREGFTIALPPVNEANRKNETCPGKTCGMNLIETILPLGSKSIR